MSLPGRSKLSLARAWVIWLLALAPATATAQEEEISWRTIFTGTTDVNVVNVDVVVTDRKGQPVTGLGVEHFRLFENGEPVEISNFYAASGPTAGPAPEATESGEAAIPRRLHHIVLFVDQANIAGTNRARILDRLRQYLLDSWREDLRLMVVSTGPTLTLHGDGFANSAFEAIAALESVRAASVGVPRFDFERRQLLREIADLQVEACSGFLNTNQGTAQEKFQAEICLEIYAEARSLLPRVRSLAEQQAGNVRRTLGVIEQFVGMAAGLGGRKSVLYISDGMPVQPAGALFESLARRLDPIGHVTQIRPAAEAQRYDLAPAFERLATRANTAGVVFYTLYSERRAALEGGSAAEAVTLRGNYATWSSNVTADLERTAQESLVIMAEETGGRHALGAENAEAVLQGLIEDGDNYYSLGYLSEPLEENRARNIQVKASDENWRLRFRRRFGDLDLVQRTEEHTRAALLAQPETNPLEISVAAMQVQPAGTGRFIVPLRIGVPLERLILLPGASQHQAQVSIFVMVRDEQGRISEMTRHLCPIRIDNDEMLAARGRRAACGVNLEMRGGRQRIAVSLLDEVAALDSTLALDLVVGDRDDGELASPRQRPRT